MLPKHHFRHHSTGKGMDMHKDQGNHKAFPIPPLNYASNKLC